MLTSSKHACCKNVAKKRDQDLGDESWGRSYLQGKSLEPSCKGINPLKILKTNYEACIFSFFSKKNQFSRKPFFKFFLRSKF